MPALSRAAGVENWAGLLAGQTIGGFSAVVGTIGWNVIGPTRIAQVGKGEEALAIYASSFWMKCLATAGATGVGIVITALVVGDSARGPAILFCIASATAAFAISWYGIGIGESGIVTRYEVLPRVAAALLAIPLIIWTGSLYVYSVLLLVSVAVGVLLFHRKLYGRLSPPRPARRDLRRGMVEQTPLLLVDAVGSVLNSVPIPAGEATAPAARSAELASGDRIYRYAVMGIIAFANGMQAWVLEAAGRGRRVRVTGSLIGHAAIGVIGGGVIGSCGPLLSAVLFDGAVAAVHEVTWWYALAFLAVAITTALTRNLLLPAGHVSIFLKAAAVGAGVGIAAMLTLAVFSPGATWSFAAGLALGEATTALVLALPAYRAFLALRNT